jgi:hypothetical protein
MVAFMKSSCAIMLWYSCRWNATRPVRCIPCVTAAVPKYVPTPANIGVKRLKLRLSGPARKSQKRFRDTPRFKFQAVLARTQPFLSRNVEKRGDQSRFKSLDLYTRTSIRLRNIRRSTHL